MTPDEIITTIKEHYGLNSKELADRMDLESPQSIYDILKGKTRTITAGMQRAIYSAFPEINIDWITTGEGNMFISNVETGQKLTPNMRLNIAFGYLKQDRSIYNQSDMAVILKKKKSYISELLSGKRTLTKEFAQEINNTFPQISAVWLLTGEGEMTNDDSQESTGLLMRIKVIAENENITISELERVIGASKGVLSRAINNGTDIQAKWICAIVKRYPQYSAKWLLTGEKPVKDDGYNIRSLDEKLEKVVNFIDLITGLSNKN